MKELYLLLILPLLFHTAESTTYLTGTSQDDTYSFAKGDGGLAISEQINVANEVSSYDII